MQKPKMILFDYGQTLINEKKFDVLKGDEAVLKIAIKNPYNVNAEKLQDQADKIFREIENIQSLKRERQLLEISCNAFDTYLYESLGLEFDVDMEEVQYVFWKNATLNQAVPTKGIERLLDYLWENEIRSAVVSNMMNSSKLLKRRIDELIPNNHFEFFLSSNSYLFRKPHPFIFEMAVRRANLNPEEIWFCGDNLLCDIEGSFHAGMKPVFYPAYIDGTYGGKTNIPYIEIRCWNELIEILKSEDVNKRYL